MKTQERRDEDTVTIMAGLSLGAVVVGVGGGLLALAHWLLPVSDALLEPLAAAVMLAGAFVGGLYIARHR